MASSKWKSFEELQELINTRKYLFWGASNWIERTLDSITTKPEFIVDKSELNQGIEFNGFQVKSPADIDLESKPFVVISTVNYMSVIEDLEALGYIMGEDYCCTPLLNKRKDKDDLLNHKQTILVSSSQHSADEISGGGLYKVSLNPYKVEKVYIGKGRGISYHDNLYYLIDMLRGVVILDKQFNEVGVIKIQKNSEPHGICIDPKRGWICIGQPGRDSVAIYCIETHEFLKEYFVSNKWKSNKKDNHHVNDPFIYDDSLYISMFSFTGNWLNEVYDGGVLEIDLNEDKIIGKVFTDKWMPHSITRVNGKLTLLNSMVGELWCSSYGLVGKTSGFARGLAYDKKYFYIGITEHRYPEKLHGLSNNISMDTGFYLFDPITKMSKFYNMNNIESIHSLIILQD
jgi:hypothetical protein